MMTIGTSQMSSLFVNALQHTSQSHNPYGGYSVRENGIVLMRLCTRQYKAQALSINSKAIWWDLLFVIYRKTYAQSKIRNNPQELLARVDQQPDA